MAELVAGTISRMLISEKPRVAKVCTAGPRAGTTVAAIDGGPAWTTAGSVVKGGPTRRRRFGDQRRCAHSWRARRRRSASSPGALGPPAGAGMGLEFGDGASRTAPTPCASTWATAMPARAVRAARLRRRRSRASSSSTTSTSRRARPPGRRHVRMAGHRRRRHDRHRLRPCRREPADQRRRDPPARLPPAEADGDGRGGPGSGSEAAVTSLTVTVSASAPVSGAQSRVAGARRGRGDGR